VSKYFRDFRLILREEEGVLFSVLLNVLTSILKTRAGFVKGVGSAHRSDGQIEAVKNIVFCVRRLVNVLDLEPCNQDSAFIAISSMLVNLGESFARNVVSLNIFLDLDIRCGAAALKITVVLVGKFLGRLLRGLNTVLSAVPQKAYK
jgi:hypothetical protein